VVESTVDFLDKVRRTIAILGAEMPDCCRPHVALAAPTAAP
jgi:hypothetical protein